MPGAKNSTGMIIGLVIGGVVLCCGGSLALIGGAGWWAFNKTKGFVTCGITIQQLRDATIAYAEDHKGQLPKSATWMDDVRPYLKKETTDTEGSPFKVNTEGVYACTEENSSTGIAFNSALSGKNLSSIKDPSKTFVVFEVPEPPKNNLSVPYKPLPRETSPSIMGEKHRGWYRAPVTGSVLLGEGKFSGSGNSIEFRADTHRKGSN